MNLGKSSSEISQEISGKEKEISEALKNQYLVEQEILSLQRKMLELQLKKKDFETANSKAKHILRQLTIELKELTAKFWQVKDSGL